MSPIVPLKRCSKCQQEKPATTEYFHRCSRDGLQWACKECRKKEDRSSRLQRMRERYHNDADYRNRITERARSLEYRERQNMLRRERYSNDTEYREKINHRNSEGYKQRRQKQPKKIRPKVDKQQKRREYKSRSDVKAKNREYNRRPEVRARVAARRRTPEGKAKVREYSRLQYVRRLARKSDMPNDFTEADWQYMTDYWHGCCAICERPLRDLFGAIEESIDHWIPLVKGGGTVPNNMLPMCFGKGGCNTTKNARDPIEWLTEKLGKRKARQKMKEIEAFFASVRKTN